MAESLDSVLAAGGLDVAISFCEQRIAQDPSCAQFHADLGACLLRKGELEGSAQEFRKAMLLDEHMWADGCQFLSRLGQLVTAELKQLEKHKVMNQRFSGPPYLQVLRMLHEVLLPKSYIEIGVHTGGSLSLALPATIAIGIDPAPVVKEKLTEKTRVFELTSDDFFTRHALPELLGKSTFDLAFIDGLHLWEQALKDFINLEKYASQTSVIVLHDCMPLDEITSQRVRDSLFYTGDVWKTAACLRSERKDLRMAMVPAAPTGLCLVTGLNSSEQTLSTNFNSLYQKWTPLGFADVTAHPEWMPDKIENSREAILSWLGR